MDFKRRQMQQIKAKQKKQKRKTKHQCSKRSAAGHRRASSLTLWCFSLQRRQLNSCFAYLHLFALRSAAASVSNQRQQRNRRNIRKPGTTTQRNAPSTSELNPTAAASRSETNVFIFLIGSITLRKRPHCGIQPQSVGAGDEFIEGHIVLHED